MSIVDATGAGDQNALSTGAVADMWRLERLDVGLFRGWCIEGAPLRAFGGQVAAQALAAAAADVDDGRLVNSLHTYFVRPGDTRKPILYQVEDTRDGRSMSVRRVTAMQSGEAILLLASSFHTPEPGPDHGPLAPVAAVPDSDDAPDSALLSPERRAEAAWLLAQSEKFRFEMRFGDRPTTLTARQGDIADGQLFWFRSRDRLSDDPVQHACALTYASDFYLLSTALAVHGLSVRGGGIRASSLDHAIWFHRHGRVDEWLLYEQSSPTSASGRGLSAGHIFDQRGALLATVMQEGLMRRTTPTPAGADHIAQA